jgi:2-methylcitrate dehydratase PrpD
MTITLKDGTQKTAEISNPIGHHDRPMSDAQAIDKFRGLAGRKLPPSQLDKILDRIWRIENDGDWATLFDDLRIAGQ